MSIFFDDVYGNAEIKALFSSCIKENKLSHAYMIAGPYGSGKKTFTLAAASELARHTGASAELIEKIAGGHSPDILTIPTEEKRIGIDTVRAFVSTVYLTPNELDFKVYIFEDADRLTPQAQNALLKIIEEPPYGVYIFLLCENPGALLQTVRSRVISINMQTFSAEQTYAFLEKEGLSSPDERGDFAVRMSRGAFGAVKEFISEESKDFGAYKKACEVISALSKKNRSVAYFDLLSLVSGAADTSDALALLLKYLLIIYRDIFSAQNSEDIELVLLDDDTAVHYASLFSVSTVIRALEIASEVQGNMRFNTNIGLSAVYLAENLWRIT